MASSSDIRTQWNTSIWTNATVTAMTTKIYQYDITDSSRKERDAFYYSQKINFFTSIYNRAENSRNAKSRIEYIHRVEVNYYLEQDTTGAAFNNVIDRLQTLEGLVRSELGSTWQSNVDYFRLETVNDPVPLTIDDRNAWRGQQIYIAFDRTDI